MDTKGKRDNQVTRTDRPSNRNTTSRPQRPEKLIFHLGKENTPNLKVSKDGLGDLVQLVIYSSDTRTDPLSIVLHRPIGSLRLDGDDWVSSSYDDYHFLMGDQSNDSHMREITKLRENFNSRVCCLISSRSKTQKEMEFLDSLGLNQIESLEDYLVQDQRKSQSLLSEKWPEAIRGRSLGWLKDQLKQEAKTAEDITLKQTWKLTLKQFKTAIEETGLEALSKTKFPPPELREVVYRNSAPQQAVSLLRGIPNAYLSQALVRYLSGDFESLERYRRPGLELQVSSLFPPEPKVPEETKKPPGESKTLHGGDPSASTKVEQKGGGTNDVQDAICQIDLILSKISYPFADMSKALLALANKNSRASKEVRASGLSDVRKLLTPKDTRFEDLVLGNVNAFIG